MTAGMIFQCSACRALVAASGVVVEGARAGLPCAACGALNWLPTIGSTTVDVVAASSALPSLASLPISSPPTALPAPPPLAPLVVMAPVTVPSMAVVPAAPSAVAAASFAPDVVARVDGKLLAPTSEAQTRLATRFTRLLSDQWHNDVEHKQLLKAAAADNELAFVGARYRAVLDVVREEPRARAAQQELIGLAMATMQPTQPSGSSSTTGATAAKAVLALVIVGALIAGGVAAARWVKTSMTPLSSVE